MNQNGLPCLIWATTLRSSMCLLHTVFVSSVLNNPVICAVYHGANQEAVDVLRMCSWHKISTQDSNADFRMSDMTLWRSSMMHPSRLDQNGATGHLDRNHRALRVGKSWHRSLPVKWWRWQAEALGERTARYYKPEGLNDQMLIQSALMVLNWPLATKARIISELSSWRLHQHWYTS